MENEEYQFNDVDEYSTIESDLHSTSSWDLVSANGGSSSWSLISSFSNNLSDFELSTDDDDSTVQISSSDLNVSGQTSDNNHDNDIDKGPGNRSSLSSDSNISEQTNGDRNVKCSTMNLSSRDLAISKQTSVDEDSTGSTMNYPSRDLKNIQYDHFSTRRRNTPPECLLSTLVIRRLLDRRQLEHRYRNAFPRRR